MKKLIPTALVALFVIPQYAFAGWPFWFWPPQHHHISGSQVVDLGAAGAAVVVLAAYLMLRRKNAKQS